MRITKFFMLLLLFFISFFIISAPLYAETAYVTGKIKITLRTGPETDHKIINMLSTGAPLEVLEEGELWTRVLTSSGKDGWVMTRFIDKKLPYAARYENLEKEYYETIRQVDYLKQENRTLKRENKKTKSNLIKNASELKETKESYKKLRHDSANYLKLKKQYDQAVSDIGSERKKIKELQKLLNDMSFSKKIKWFVSGAAVLLVGVIFGSFSNRKKRKYKL